MMVIGNNSHTVRWHITPMIMDTDPLAKWSRGYPERSFPCQANIVNQTEGLQDFRRRQEGHLIIADDAWLPKKNTRNLGCKQTGLGKWL